MAKRKKKMYICPACGRIDSFPSVSVTEWGCPCGAMFAPEDAAEVAIAEARTEEEGRELFLWQ